MMSIKRAQEILDAKQQRHEQMVRRWAKWRGGLSRAALIATLLTGLVALLQFV